MTVLLAPRCFFEDVFKFLEIIDHGRVHFGRFGIGGTANDGERCRRGGVGGAAFYIFAGKGTWTRIRLDWIGLRPSATAVSDFSGARSIAHGSTTSKDAQSPPTVHCPPRFFGHLHARQCSLTRSVVSSSGTWPLCELARSNSEFKEGCREESGHTHPCFRDLRPERRRCSLARCTRVA